MMQNGPVLLHRHKSRIPSLENLGFLMQTEAPLSKIKDPHVMQPELKVPKLENPEALAALQMAVQNHDFAGAEFIFDQSASLHDNPEALELVLKNYCNMNDFTTAKAVLLQVQKKMSRQGFIKFMIACFRHSENSDDLQETFEAAIKQYPADESIVSAALFGFKVLRDRPRIEALQKYIKSKGLLRKLPLLQVQVYDSYLNGNFDAALELGRTIAARISSEPPSLLRLDMPYRWAIRYFAQDGNVEAIEKIQKHVAELSIPTTISFSNIVLTILPPLYPNVPLVSWLDRCVEWGWKIDRSSFSKLTQLLYRWYPSQHERIAKLRSSLGKTIPQSSGSKEVSRSSELSAIQKFINLGDPSKCLYILDSMRRRGMIPPYYYHVLIFEALAKRGLTTDIEQLVAKMKALEYPRHCAGTDLAMLELQLRQAAKGKNRTRSEKLADAQRGLIWVNQYLVEYPLIQHDLSQLTRIATLFMHCRQPDIAGQVVDFLRWQSESGKFTAQNHDSRSLTVLLKAEQQCNRSPVATLDTLLSDRPRIFIDLKLKRHLRESLTSEQWKHYYSLIKSHNEWVVENICQEVEQLAQFVKSGACT
ncbi:hypothetical protein B9G98_03862 [Wickerhamiella sorbophila]|uniref:Uncharacterized protein n=1 Tax=Wickerhamiella sorbophila TaxID=45607 RepID=A0A2T0FMM7_9ASCO|nr:hypothetical protein B9G98_03862 [Wickerhamiella sorbophila]PRT56242.1 hypothetical protein B9G98_03862 [Wickerhamiella sorbophila]